MFLNKENISDVPTSIILNKESPIYAKLTEDFDEYIKKFKQTFFSSNKCVPIHGKSDEKIKVNGVQDWISKIYASQTTKFIHWLQF